MPINENQQNFRLTISCETTVLCNPWINIEGMGRTNPDPSMHSNTHTHNTHAT